MVNILYCSRVSSQGVLIYSNISVSFLFLGDFAFRFRFRTIQMATAIDIPTMIITASGIETPIDTF